MKIKTNKLIRQASVRIDSLILTIRGHRVILDADLASAFGVRSRRLNEQVRRNFERFPDDFVFQLTEAEKIEVVANCDHLRKLKFSSSLPFAFTEHGVIMAANILRSSRAAQMSIFVVRAFVRLREAARTYRELASRLDALEDKVGKHDGELRALLAALRESIVPPSKPKRPIGFRVEESRIAYVLKRIR